MALYEIDLETTAADTKRRTSVLVHASYRKGGYEAARKKAEWKLNASPLNQGWLAVSIKQVG
jgi:hypothetical protein